MIYSFMMRLLAMGSFVQSRFDAEMARLVNMHARCMLASKLPLENKWYSFERYKTDVGTVAKDVDKFVSDQTRKTMTRRPKTVAGVGVSTVWADQEQSSKTKKLAVKLSAGIGFREDASRFYTSIMVAMWEDLEHRGCFLTWNLYGRRRDTETGLFYKNARLFTRFWKSAPACVAKAFLVVPHAPSFLQKYDGPSKKEEGAIEPMAMAQLSEFIKSKRYNAEKCQPLLSNVLISVCNGNSRLLGKHIVDAMSVRCDALWAYAVCGLPRVVMHVYFDPLTKGGGLVSWQSPDEQVVHRQTTSGHVLRVACDLWLTN
jgi:hypothetical protein